MRRGKPIRFPVLLAALTVAAAALGGCAEPDIIDSDNPIIAHLYADPANYDGRQVTIYGLVVEADRDGRWFMLQDVSQMRLKVVRTDGLPTIVGDQVLIRGPFKANRGNPYLEARQVTYTKVLGGGGCC